MDPKLRKHLQEQNLPPAAMAVIAMGEMNETYYRKLEEMFPC